MWVQIHMKKQQFVISALEISTELFIRNDIFCKRISVRKLNNMGVCNFYELNFADKISLVFFLLSLLST